MIKSCNWSKSDVKVKSILPVILVLGKSIKHLRGTLRMSNVCDLVNSGLIPNEVNLGRCIMMAHFNEREFPKSFVLLRV